jgi:DUF4097 and DUF4098 domain-containing protein YvlB
MASQPPNTPPQYPPQYAYVDPRAQRQAARAQAQYARAQYQAARARARAMRRRSILGPVLLLAIGIGFLLSTMHIVDPRSFFLWYGQWWPLLLIAGGAVLLLEWALDTRAINAGTPRGTRIGGGAIWLIIVLVFVGFAATGTREWNWNGFRHNFDGNDDFSAMFMGPQHQSDQEVTQAIPAGASLMLENLRGDITVASVTDAGSASDGTLKISMHKTIYGGSDNEAQRRLDNFKPSITTSGNTVLVRIDGGNDASANVVVSVPAKAVLDLHSHHGDITVTGHQADVNIASDHGDVKVDTITGAVRGKLDHGDFFAHDIKGDVSMNGRHFGDVTVSDVTGLVTLEGDFYGDTHVEHVGSPFHLHSSRTDFAVAKLDGTFSLDSGDLRAEQAAGPVKIETRSKDISLNRVSGDVTIDNSNGSVDVEAALPLGDYNVKNRNGHVKVTLPENAGFIVAARAYQGDLENDFALTKTGSEHSGELSGTVGKGGPRLNLTADHGDVELRKGEVASVAPPAPPAPPRNPKTPKEAPAAAPAAPEAPARP